ncbi:hypothetical protein SAMN04487969_11516 [Paenibacillus algorifonticola]|uniref:Short C-terminal domain-containing protein n=1 Tax=Paenibacillus algorifonticola TaxID=684063 RepID=A0A1I2G991_9BACL|nr:hypothetical protein [Paenibacillus algorifonticola]SFF13739.1 hypothetical protein SAMN04487969_11516 [Paenibacillus algorifonticola]
MKGTKTIVASAIALSLVVGGGALAIPAIHAASTDTSTQSSTDGSGTTREAGKHRGGSFGFGQWKTQLAEYLKLDEATLDTQLKTQTLAEVASAQGVDRETLKAKLVEWIDAAAAERKEKLQSENPDKTLDGINADKQWDSSAIADKILDSKGQAGLGGEGGQRGGGKGGFGKGGGYASEETATVLGVTADELKTELKAGKSLADIAAEKGVDVQKVIDQKVSEEKARLDQALTDGKLTQEQYDAKIAKLTERVTQFVNGEFTKPEGDGTGRQGKHGKRDTAVESTDAAADQTA